MLKAFCSAKGVSQLPTINKQQPTKKTFTLIVGISDYQDTAIPDLRFAERDATLLVELLKTSSLGKLDDDHLKSIIGKRSQHCNLLLQWIG